jgi:DnaJ-class molecular chaperone
MTMNPYKVLGIEKSATQAQIKKAYHKNAIKHHPDKGGDHEKFQEISKAYQILSDPKKKERYDRFGTIDDNGTNDIDPTEIFANLFGGGARQAFNMNFGNGGSFSFGGFPGGMRFRPGSKVNINGRVFHVNEQGQPIEKADDIIERIPLTLTDIYNGKQITILEKYKVTIEPGSFYGKKFTFKGKGQKGEGNKQDGDLVIILIPSENDEIQSKNRFEYDNNGNLIYTKDINIIESLTGLEYEIHHPDGNTYIIKEEEIIQYNENIKVIPNKGFPKNKEKTEFGNLVIRYNIHYRDIGSGIISRIRKIHQRPKLSEEYREILYSTKLDRIHRSGRHRQSGRRNRNEAQGDGPGECPHQ